jgi:hypothetical protein
MELHTQMMICLVSSDQSTSIIHAKSQNKFYTLFLISVRNWILPKITVDYQLSVNLPTNLLKDQR